ncbi:MAG: succinyl-diaminopimelate desuccinylase [Alphaproteobacteria bacterium]|nr:succinyl-diaminopimelate desuccinylase [Alphaproteobacteria bacterium]
MNPFTDPLALAQALIRCPSVTPNDAGALDLLEDSLEQLGFMCWRETFSEPGTPDVDNLYARFGTSGHNFCFAGHSDVVPAGEGWSVDPFGGQVIGNYLFGRGATDMKGAIACFIAAMARILASGTDLAGSVSLLITGDEEGPSINGTRKVLAWLKDNEETIDSCLVGEPTNPSRLGDMLKIGRRGSLNGRLLVHGIGGHTAYPELADNPILRLLRMVTALTSRPLDEGTEHFQPSTLEISTVDVGNPATNVIPATARANFNVRFNPLHTGESMSAWLRRTLDEVGGSYQLDLMTSGEPFQTAPGALTTLVSQAIIGVTGRTPVLSTTGGTSDARFIKDTCPVVEFGLAGQTMHKADERVSLTDLEQLTTIYRRIIESAMLTPPC